MCVHKRTCTANCHRWIFLLVVAIHHQYHLCPSCHLMCLSFVAYHGSSVLKRDKDNKGRSQKARKVKLQSTNLAKLHLRTGFLLVQKISLKIHSVLQGWWPRASIQSCHRMQKVNNGQHLGRMARGSDWSVYPKRRRREGQMKWVKMMAKGNYFSTSQSHDSRVRKMVRGERKSQAWYQAGLASWGRPGERERERKRRKREREREKA